MLNIYHLSKFFDKKIVADNINLKVEKGHILAILGQSGCGKSTLLKMISGLITPDNGEIWLNEKNITSIPIEKRNISLMFQDYALFPHLNVIENVSFGLKIQGISSHELLKKAKQALAEVNLTNEAYRSINELSGGEQQRLALARALITSPQLLLLDEAFSSLDSQLRQQIRQQTLDKIQKKNIPAILVTHDPEEAISIASHIALMDKGNILQYGTPQELIQQPINTHAAHLLNLHNIHTHYYIPQQAIFINKQHPQALPCTITKSTNFADYCHLNLTHPLHGELTFNLSWHESKKEITEAQYNQKKLYIHIDESQIVYF